MRSLGRAVVLQQLLAAGVCRSERARSRSLARRRTVAAGLARDPLLEEGQLDRSGATGVGDALNPGWFSEDTFTKDAQKIQEMPPYIGWSRKAPKPTGPGCQPRCEWECPASTECDQTCQPYCMPPRCQTFCERNEADSCETRCGPPQCSVVCPPGRLSGDPTGHCQTVCVPPVCRTECGNVKGKCQSECEEPSCTWKCELAVACPKPNCTLRCSGIKECAQPRPLPQAKKLGAPAADRVGVTYGDATLDVNILAHPATPYPEFTPTTRSTTTTTVAYVAAPVAPAVASTTPAAATTIGPVRKLKLRWAAEDDWPPSGSGGGPIPLPRPMAPTWLRPTPLGGPGPT